MKTANDRFFVHNIEFEPDAGAEMLKKQWAIGLDTKNHGKLSGERKRSAYAQKANNSLTGER
ncbi:hypothetical protein HYW46_03025 [Candidatus Daviesbacteria bacterium]|nr:hypothetical protein [Candidatus Daviesbacteria bacterium]